MKTERLKKICEHQDTWNKEDFDALEELRKKRGLLNVNFIWTNTIEKIRKKSWN